MNEFIIKETTINDILNYLAKQPYGKVARLINEIQSIKPVPVVVPDDGKDKK